MFHNDAHFCGEHKHWTPRGRICPECNREMSDRQERARHPDWNDVVPLGRRLEFIKTEHIYCRDEEHEFNKYDGADLTHNEYLRTLVMEKRQEFLELFLRVLKDERTGEKQCLLTQK